jgi:two-component system KDP operon response regulator KdpE
MKSLRGAKILIVDDQPQFRRVLRLALEARGCHICEAPGGTQAVDFMRSEIPDLVLVDWQMQGLDGLQLCRAIRVGSDVPIIMITSRHDGRPRALAAGANDYLTKPFALDDLLDRIESALSG